MIQLFPTEEAKNVEIKEYTPVQEENLEAEEQAQQDEVAEAEEQFMQQTDITWVRINLQMPVVKRIVLIQILLINK